MIPSLWRQTPWGKANGGQWRYALRNALAMCLSLWLAFVLQLDSPYWAMTSAAVVSFPTVGGVISKSLGQVVGSLIGAMAAVMITGLGIGDPWLFSLLIALWLGVHLHLQPPSEQRLLRFRPGGLYRRHHRLLLRQPDRPATYLRHRPGPGERGDRRHPLRRPDDDDPAEFLRWRDPAGLPGKSQTRLLEHAQLLWLGETGADVRTAHEGVIGQILTLNVLRIQAVWSHHRLRRHNQLLNYCSIAS